jgi:hypothetical protein
VAFAAVGISLLAYENQRSANAEQVRANQAAAASAERQYAEKVTYLDFPVDHTPYEAITVENSSNVPVAAVGFLIKVDYQFPHSANPPPGFRGGAGLLFLGNIDSCKTAVINPGSVIRRAATREAGMVPVDFGFEVEKMLFIDRNGVPWSYGPGGLKKDSSYPRLLSSDSSRTRLSIWFITPNYATARSCS